LQAVAARCQKNLRDIDAVGRYGGDEFVVLLPESDLNGARSTGERLRRCIADIPVDTDRGPLNVTISLGVAALTDDYPHMAALLNEADAALYRAKNAGRNQVAV
jgi:diguanylate cyclase (GGDEF)-like protein